MKFEGSALNLNGRQDDSPEYKVSFWTWQGSGWLEECTSITEADADEVLAWATDNAGGRHVTVWARSVRRPLDGEPVSDDVRLLGTEPTGDDSLFPPWARRHTIHQGPPTPPPPSTLLQAEPPRRRIFRRLA